MDKHRYAVILDKGEDGYIVAHVPALRGLWTQGKTRAEALSNVREAIELFIESARENNESLPQEDDELVEVTA